MRVEQRFPNSVLLLTGREAGEIPESLGGSLLSATESCVAIGTANESDRATTVELAQDIDLVEKSGLLGVFDGTLHLDAPELCLMDTALNVVASIPVVSTAPRVSIFANDPSEPDRIVVVVESEAGLALACGGT